MGVHVCRGMRWAVGGRDVKWLCLVCEVVFLFGLALEYDGGNKAGIAADGVADFLSAAVRQQHVIKALGVVSVPGLLVAEVVAVVVLNGPVEGVNWFLVVGSERMSA